MSAVPIGTSRPAEDPGTPIDPYRPAPLAPRRPVLVSAPPRGREDTRPRARPEPLPDATRWSGAMIAALSDVLVGVRPAQQLNRWLAPDLYARVARRAGLAIRLNGRPAGPPRARVLGLRLTEPVPNEHEVAAVVHDGVRLRAVAMRIRKSGGRWHVVDAEIG